MAQVVANSTPTPRLWFSAALASAFFLLASGAAQAATVGPNFCLAGSSASLCNMQIDLRSGGEDDHEDDEDSPDGGIIYQPAGYVGVTMAISDSGTGAGTLHSLSFTLDSREAEGARWGFTDLWLNLVPGALTSILPNLKTITQSTESRDGATTSGNISFTNGFSFKKKGSTATGSNYYSVMKDPGEESVGPWGTFNFGLQAANGQREDDPLVRAQITLTWDAEGPALNNLLTQAVMQLNGTNAGAPGGAGGQSAAALLFAWEVAGTASRRDDDGHDGHDDDDEDHENEDLRSYYGAWPAAADQVQTPAPVPLPLPALLLLSTLPLVMLRRRSA